MSRRVSWRFLDRGEEVFFLDAARIDWIRTHEPHKLRPVAFATVRNARRVLQFGLLTIAWSIWWIVRATWIPGYSDPQRWFTAGLLLGAGCMTVSVSRLLAYLAYLRGEVEERPRPAAEEAPAR